MGSRDAHGRFLPGSSGRPKSPDKLPTTVIGVKVSVIEAEMSHAAARRRFTTISALIRSFLRRLHAEDGHRIR